MTDTLALRRAAGGALRSLRRPGIRLSRLAVAPRDEPLRPALAIEAMLAAAGALFDVQPAASDKMLRPALADWRDAVGCADPLLLPANANELLPLPLPSWCAFLLDANLLRLAGSVAVDGPRVTLPAWLLAVREAELDAVECFPVLFAGRFAPAGVSVQVHLALSPPFLSPQWRGPVWVRAAAHREGAPVRLWVGGPSSPRQPAPGATGESVATWVTHPPPSPALAQDAPDWPPGWPRWTVLRLLEGREPQALWDLQSLWRARMGAAPEGGSRGTAAAAPVTMRLAVDLGSTSTMAVEEDSALAGSVGGKLLQAPHPPSGLRRLAGAAESAARFGCGEELLAPGGHLPTALASGSSDAIAAMLRGEADAIHQLWLPQGADEPLRADRFKSPDLVLLADWLAQLPGEWDPAHVSRRLLETYGHLLGRTLAASHAAPLVTPEGGRWSLHWPHLREIEAVLTHPECAWRAADGESFHDVYSGVARELCAGLAAAWARATHRLVPDPAAARKASVQGRAAEYLRHPIDAFVDFGGLTVQITVRLPRAEGRPAPFVAGSSMSYLLGGERLIDAAAYAAADGERDAYRATARRWRTLISDGGRLPADSETAAAGKAILDTVLALVRRQLEGTLRRAAPSLSTLRGAGVRLYLLGDGWKLAALDVPDEDREAETLRRLSHELLWPGLDVQMHRMDKRRLCEGALRADAAPHEEDGTVELQGIDVSAPADSQRWFGVVDPAAAAAAGEVAPAPGDPWWQAFAADVAQSGSLLRVEQWFRAGEPPFRSGLAGGKVSFDPHRSLLKQWIDLSGPSLVALRIRSLLHRPSS
jgi:hypothetical protein